MAQAAAESGAEASVRAVIADDQTLAVPASVDRADAVGLAHQVALSAKVRKGRGVHYTPPEVAAELVELAVRGWTREGPWRVLDPAVGGGSFLLAAGRHQVACGVDPLAVASGLTGIDIDPLAIEVAAEALRRWGPDGHPTLLVGDGLDDLDPLVGDIPFDLVVGNPPFLGQLTTATARDTQDRDRLHRRFGSAANGYVDSAALFLLAAVNAVGVGGRVMLVLPQSVLGSSHAEEARRRVEESAEIIDLWVPSGRVFDAAVDVCALVVERRTDPDRAGRTADGLPSTVSLLGPSAVRREPPPRSGPPDGPSEGPSRGAAEGRRVTWSARLARRQGVPVVGIGADRADHRAPGSSLTPDTRLTLDDPLTPDTPVTPDVPAATRLGDLITATAGFRQHHYAVVDHLSEHREGLIPVVTTGMVDPLVIGWGERSARIGGRRWERPAVDLEALSEGDPAVGRWFAARRRPKLLVAPQTRVVEAAVDAEGRFLPSTPLVSVEVSADDSPFGVGLDVADEVEALWLVAAALSAPPVTAWAHEQSAGTGRGSGAVRLSVRLVLDVPLPTERERWEAATARLRDGCPLVDAATDLTEAYGLAADHPVVSWWRALLPR